MKRSFQLFLGLSLSFFISVSICQAESATQAPQANTAPQNSILTRRDIERFAIVMAQIHNYYIKPTDYHELFDDAIRGMLTGLDPHSDYLNKKEYASLKNTTEGHYAGIGVEVTPENGMIKVVSPFDDTPAANAGLQPGDLIARVDGKLIKNMSANEAIELIKGKPGTSLKLTLIREGKKTPINVTLQRAIVRIKSVKAKLIHKDVGVIRISMFSDSTAKDTEKAIKKLNRISDGKLTGIVLDLRNNPGGVLQSAVQTSNLFLDANRLPNKNQKIVYTKGRATRSNLQADVTTNDFTNGLPMIVIINAGSASASEIVAGALQDHRRAIVLGTKSFGKGSVQTVIPIDNETAIKLTTALYYTPNGRSIQASGIKPDVYVPYTKMPLDEQAANLTNMIDESQLRGHLIVNKAEAKINKELREEKSKLAQTDFQLYQAINFLQGMRALAPTATITNQGASS